MSLELEQILIHIDRLLESERSLRGRVLLQQIKQDIQKYLALHEQK